MLHRITKNCRGASGSLRDPCLGFAKFRFVTRLAEQVSCQVLRTRGTSTITGRYTQYLKNFIL
ncbi:hypothetical protein EHQ81_19385 [Leptospira selangorensis]|uniref:Uncharacterized protein n=1 Tax=Leptospira selangorensis TaxID=2484982 RepID=A0A5F2C6D8_9LEPT|nr:hypothetical protein EHQ81_19385 [Leptospira selangorensis]TGM27933.1 hypothetical protein EHQ82_01560 [Leptospira selangorensis]